MSAVKNTGRIPASETSEFSLWELPEVNEGQIIHAEKTRRDIAKSTTGNTAPTIDNSTVVYSKLTAGQIKDISDRIREDIHKEAYQQGLQKGRKEGFDAGIKDGQQKIQAQLQNLASIGSYLVDALQSQDNQIEKGLVNMSMSVAQSVLRRELTIDSSHMQDIVSEAISTISEASEPVRVFLNPQDFQQLTESEYLPSEWLLQADASLSPGGCRIKNQFSVVEYTSEDQFQQTVKQLVDSRFDELQRQERERSDAQPDDE